MNAELLGNSGDEDLGEDSRELARRQISKVYKSFSGLYPARQFIGRKWSDFKDSLIVVYEFHLSRILSKGWVGLSYGKKIYSF